MFIEERGIVLPHHLILEKKKDDVVLNGGRQNLSSCACCVLECSADFLVDRPTAAAECRTPAAMASISGRRGHDNQRRRIGLKTTDKEQAGALALEFYLKLRALGWEQALRWWKRGDSTPTKKSKVTIGEYLDAVREKSQIHPKTLESFSAALRKIASDIARLDSNSKRSAWREQVDAIKLASLTTEEIEEWRASFIKRGSTNPLAEKSAKVSANSFIGRARSLFSADVIARVKDIVEIPSPAPFAGVKVERVRATRYRSTFDIATLLEKHADGACY